MGGLGAIPPPVRGDYHGRATLRVENAAMWLDVLSSAGPRIVRLGLAGSEVNLLAETPDLGWETPHGRYELLGGHRLWFAPEDPAAVAVPDAEGLVAEVLPNGIRLCGRIEPVTGLVRSIEIRLDPATPTFAFRHELRNRGAAPLELAPWSITQLPLGGRVLLPQRRAAPGHGVRPNRNLVLWPYTSWGDPRISIQDGLVVIGALGGGDLKLGTLSDAGWVAYERDGVAIVRRFEPALGERHADLECNVETFCGSRYLELEVLGPLGVLEPGASTTLLERWEIRATGAAHDVMALAADLAAPLDALDRGAA